MKTIHALVALTLSAGAAEAQVTQLVCNGGLSGGTITSTGTCALDLTHNNIWTGTQTFSVLSTFNGLNLATGSLTATGVLTVGSPLDLAPGNLSQPSWTVNGPVLSGTASTLTDTTGTGTVTTEAVASLPADTVAASNAITVTNLATLYVPAPAAGTNVTATNRYAGYFNGLASNGLTLASSALAPPASAPVVPTNYWLYNTQSVIGTQGYAQAWSPYYRISNWDVDSTAINGVSPNTTEGLIWDEAHLTSGFAGNFQLRLGRLNIVDAPSSTDASSHLYATDIEMVNPQAPAGGIDLDYLHAKGSVWARKT